METQVIPLINRALIETSMTSSDIQQLENNIKEAQKMVDLGKALERLMNNRDFKAVVSTGFFKDEPVRLVHLMASPAMQRPEHQQAIQLQLRAIGEFHNYLNEVFRQASLAAKAIEEDEQTRDELLAEEV